MIVLGEINGLLRSTEKTENRWNTLGSVAVTLLEGKKSDDPSSPSYISTIFDHIKSPQKRKAEQEKEEVKLANKT